MGMYNIFNRYPVWGIGGVNMYKTLKALRVKEGYTLQEMSSFLGYNSPNAYARKEKGERKFTLEEVKTISILFDKSVEQIFFTQQVPDKENQDDHLA